MRLSSLWGCSPRPGRTIVFFLCLYERSSKPACLRCASSFIEGLNFVTVLPCYNDREGKVTGVARAGFFCFFGFLIGKRTEGSLGGGGRLLFEANTLKTYCVPNKSTRTYCGLNL
jgi:hypothetical protein